MTTRRPASGWTPEQYRRQVEARDVAPEYPVTVGRTFWWFVTVVNVLLGAAGAVLCVASLVSPGPDGLGAPAVLLGLVLALGWAWTLGYGTWRSWLRRAPLDGRRVVVADVDGRRSVVAGWDTVWLRAQTEGLCYLVVLLVVAGVVALRGEHPGVGVAILVLSVLLALLVPDAILRARRRVSLVLAPDGVECRGWGGVARLGWDDVQATGTFATNRYDGLRLTGKPAAASWHWQQGAFLLRRDRPATPRVDVPFFVLDVAPARLMNTVAHYVAEPSARPELADERGRARLVGPVDPARVEPRR